MLAKINEYLGWTGSEWVYAPFKWEEDLETCKETMVSITKHQAFVYLRPSDWMVVRQVENGTPISPEWDSWRQLIRDEANEKNASIGQCSSKEELNAYCQGSDYLTWTNPPS